MAIAAILTAGAANANWSYIQDGYDDGARFYVKVAGGMALSLGGDVSSNLGSVDLIAECTKGTTDACGFFSPYEGHQQDATLYDYYGAGAIELNPSTNLEIQTWTTNIAMGFVMPRSSNVRLELSWDRISESSYNASPLFLTDETTTQGFPVGKESVASLTSKMSSDIVMAMFYYDFFDGATKRPFEFIPYVGAGLGFSSTKIKSSVSDGGALATTWGLVEFVDQTGGMFPSENYSSGLALGAAVGFSYGLHEMAFLDIGAKIIMANGAEWNLTNPAGNERALISTDNVIYGIVSAGLRFEF